MGNADAPARGEIDRSPEDGGVRYGLGDRRWLEHRPGRGGDDRDDDLIVTDVHGRQWRLHAPRRGSRPWDRLRALATER